MADEVGSGTQDRGMSLWLVLAVALLLTAATSVLAFAFYVFVTVPLNRGLPFNSDLPQITNLLGSLAVFVFNPVICFVVFYRISGALVFQSSSEYLDLMKYSFVGGAAGFALGYSAELGLAAVTLGTGFYFPDIFGVIPLANLALGIVRTGLTTMFLVTAAVAFGRFRKGVLLAAGTGQSVPMNPTEVGSAAGG